MTHPQPPQPSAWDEARVRIESLVNRGAEVCPQFTPSETYMVSCHVCGYESDVHLIKRLLTARQQVEAQHAAEVKRLTADIDGWKGECGRMLESRYGETAADLQWPRTNTLRSPRCDPRTDTEEHPLDADQA